MKSDYDQLRDLFDSFDFEYHEEVRQGDTPYIKYVIVCNKNLEIDNTTCYYIAFCFDFEKRFLYMDIGLG
jgi:hypothetical protein